MEKSKQTPESEPDERAETVERLAYRSIPLVGLLGDGVITYFPGGEAFVERAHARRRAAPDR